MIAIPLIAVASTLVVTAVALRWWWRHGAIVSMPVLAAGVIALGTATGYEFFHCNVGPIPLTLDRILFGFMAVWTIAMLGLGKMKIPVWNQLDVGVFVLLAILVASTFTHDFAFRDNLPLSRLLFFNLMPIGLYFLVRSTPVRAWELIWIQWILGGLGVYLGFTAVMEVMGISSLVYPRHILDPAYFEFLGRGRGPLLNPVINGLLMTVSGLCLGMRWTATSGRMRLAVLLGIGIVAAGAGCTLTRSVWLGFLLAWLPVFWSVTNRRQKGLALCLVSVGSIVFFSGIAERLTAFKRDREVTVAQMAESARLRPIFAEVALRMFHDRPVWGCGFGQYTQAKIPYLDAPHTARPLSKAKPYMQHNVVLSYLTETGIIGAGWLLLVIGLIARIALRLWSKDSTGMPQRQWGLVTIGFLLAWFFNGMFHDVSIIPMSNMTLFLLAGVANRLAAQAAVATGEKARTPRRIITSTAIALSR